MYSLKKMKKLFNIANNRFLIEGWSLIKTDVSEPCICGTLKSYLEEELKRIKLDMYHVDVEYNRNCGKVKTIIDGKMKIINIKCDILIHSRGEIHEQDNLIAIEMKKSYQNESEKDNDRDRLRALTKSTSTNEVWYWEGEAFPRHVCGYILGVYYEVNKDEETVDIECYYKGHLFEKYKKNLKNVGKKRRFPLIS
ncbi:hypothetical protein PV797_10890 [Clostridiaceae bacterium M8S5]|nr:hypothetical protein PV797_10890 [Clostridiaceae bacterium M8S5]